jgi:NDP-sugar pyrophosphorylase family protein
VTDATSYLAVNTWALERMAQEEVGPDGYARVGDGWIAPSAKVDPTARFVGPVLVCAGSVIDRDALIVGPCTIGAECTIGPKAVVSRSVVWDRCHVGAGAFVDECILTDDASVEDWLAVRGTVYVPRHRSGQRSRDLLALCRWPGRRRS